MPMTFRGALTALSRLAVPGVQHNYDVDAVPDAPARAQLPALLVLPMELEEERLLREGGRGFQALAFSGGERSATYGLTHLLLVAPVGQSKGLRAHVPALVTLTDAYMAALAADVTLGGALRQPAAVRVEMGLFTLGGSAYYGCAFRHTWVISITPAQP